MNKKEKCVMLVCGGGNGAHVMAGLGAACPETEVHVLTLFKDEAKTWTENMKKKNFTLHFKKDGKDTKKLQKKPTVVSKDPKIAKHCNMIVFVVPAFGHVEYLKAMKPYVDPGTTIIGLPGQPGFEFDVYGILGEVGTTCTIGNFESLPWSCRIVEYGQDVEILGTKNLLAGAIRPGKKPASLTDPRGALQKVLGDHPHLEVCGHILGMTLMATNAYLHTSILYSKWVNHDFERDPVRIAPLFYHGIDQAAVDVLSQISDEVVGIADVIMKKHKVNLSTVIHISDWFKEAYSSEITDKSSLLTCIKTNKAYLGLAHPMIPIEDDPDGNLQIDVKNRYFREDVPFGLVCIRGIAEIVGYPTPVIDKVIIWMQEKMGREYIVDDKLAGADLNNGRSAQKYGFTTLEQILGL